jgi:hypothetical protein
VPAELRLSIDEQAAVVVADLKLRLCSGPKNRTFNWCIDIFVRWHREALYFVAVMQTPHGRPPTFEAHVARMEHAGRGEFNVAVPMRRGWNTIKMGLSPEECLKQIGESVYL